MFKMHLARCCREKIIKNCRPQSAALHGLGWWRCGVDNGTLLAAWMVPRVSVKCSLCWADMPCVTTLQQTCKQCLYWVLLKWYNRPLNPSYFGLFWSFNKQYGISGARDWKISSSKKVRFQGWFKAQNGSIFALQNFEGCQPCNYLRQSINFGNSCVHLSTFQLV